MFIFLIYKILGGFNHKKPLNRLKRGLQKKKIARDFYKIVCICGQNIPKHTTNREKVNLC